MCAAVTVDTSVGDQSLTVRQPRGSLKTMHGAFGSTRNSMLTACYNEEFSSLLSYGR